MPVPGRIDTSMRPTFPTIDGIGQNWEGSNMSVFNCNRVDSAPGRLPAIQRSARLHASRHLPVGIAFRRLECDLGFPDSSIPRLSPCVSAPLGFWASLSPLHQFALSIGQSSNVSDVQCKS